MKQYKNILVALDLSGLDASLIAYSKYIQERFGADKVYFVHNIKKSDIDDLIEEKQELYAEIENAIEEKLHESIRDIFQDTDTYEVLMSNDYYTETLIAYIANKYQIDLAILGNKLHAKGSGVVTDKLLQMLNCDIVMVPKGFGTIDHILVATDFSKNSKKAFILADQLAQKCDGKIDGIHIYQIPPRYMPYLSGSDESRHLQKHFEDKAKEFLNKFELNKINKLFVENANGLSVAKRISEYAGTNKYNLLVISNKGKNILSTLLVGSVTNKLVNKHMTIPLFIVK